MILNYGEFTQLNERTIKDLSLDKFAGLVCHDVRVQKEAISFLSKLLISEADISERQKIFEDIYKNDILDKLIAFDEKYKESLEFNTVSTKKFTALNTSYESELGLKILHLYVVMNGILSKCTFESNKLNELKDKFLNTVNNESFDKLGKLLNQLVNIRFAENEDYVISIDSLSSVSELIYSFNYADENDFSGIQKKRKLFQKKEEVIDFELNSILGELVDVKYKQMSEFLGQMNKAGLSIFKGLSEDILILRFVDEYMRKLGERIYPRVSSEGMTVIKRYDDIFVTLKNMNCVANDIEVDTLTIIKGENSSGKTSYLKMVGLLQILSQAGIPIKCESAAIHIYKDIQTLFASGEKTLGRFEEEVKILSELYAGAKENTLILMNEVFQSTSYYEGREALIDIMNALNSKGVDIALVTFFEDMDNVSDSQVNVRFVEGHRCSI